MNTVLIDVNELPARYAEAVSRAEQGDEVLVTAAGHPTVKLTLVRPAAPERKVILGMHPGSMEMAPDFNDPLPDEFWLGES